MMKRVGLVIGLMLGLTGTCWAQEQNAALAGPVPQQAPGAPQAEAKGQGLEVDTAAYTEYWRDQALRAMTDAAEARGAAVAMKKHLVEAQRVVRELQERARQQAQAAKAPSAGEQTQPETAPPMPPLGGAK